LVEKTYWAISYPDGLYCGTWLTRADAIAGHVHGRFRWTEAGHAVGGKLQPMQRQDWAKAKRLGDRVVRVRVEVLRPTDAQAERQQGTSR
jgi:hypothetical protein